MPSWSWSDRLTWFHEATAQSSTYERQRHIVQTVQAVMTPGCNRVVGTPPMSLKYRELLIRCAHILCSCAFTCIFILAGRRLAALTTTLLCTAVTTSADTDLSFYWKPNQRTTPDWIQQLHRRIRSDYMVPQSYDRLPWWGFTEPVCRWCGFILHHHHVRRLWTVWLSGPRSMLCCWFSLVPRARQIKGWWCTHGYMLGWGLKHHTNKDGMGGWGGYGGDMMSWGHEHANGSQPVWRATSRILHDITASQSQHRQLLTPPQPPQHPLRQL